MLKELWSASVVSCLMKTAFQKQEKGSAVLREPTLTDRRLHRFDTQSAYLREVCYLEVRQGETEDTYIVHFCKPLIYCNFTYHCTHCCALVFVFLATKTTWSGSTKPLGLLQMIRWFSAYKCWNSALTPPTSLLCLPTWNISSYVCCLNEYGLFFWVYTYKFEHTYVWFTVM